MQILLRASFLMVLSIPYSESESKQQRGAHLKRRDVFLRETWPCYLCVFLQKFSPVKSCRSIQLVLDAALTEILCTKFFRVLLPLLVPTKMIRRTVLSSPSHMCTESPEAVFILAAK